MADVQTRPAGVAAEEGPPLMHRQASVEEVEAASKIQALARGQLVRKHQKDERLWQAWNELDWKEEAELMASHQQYEELKADLKRKKSGLSDDGKPPLSPSSLSQGAGATSVFKDKEDHKATTAVSAATQPAASPVLSAAVGAAAGDATVPAAAAAPVVATSPALAASGVPSPSVSPASGKTYLIRTKSVPKVAPLIIPAAAAPPPPPAKKKVEEDDGLTLTDPIQLDFVTAMMDHFKFNKMLDLANVVELLRRVKGVLKAQPNVVYLNVATRLTIVGDLHGQLDDLLAIFKLNGLPSPRNAYVFNGDFVDRGQYSCECILTLLAFKLLYPKSMHLNRGNHEARDINSRDGFEKECMRKYNAAIFDLFSDVFTCLPLAAVINNQIFVVHGGLAQTDFTLAELQAVNRFVEIPEDDSLLCLRADEPVRRADGSVILAGEVRRGMQLQGEFGPVEVRYATPEGTPLPTTKQLYHVTLQSGDSFVVKHGHKLTLRATRNPWVATSAAASSPPSSTAGVVVCSLNQANLEAGRIEGVAASDDGAATMDKKHPMDADARARVLAEFEAGLEEGKNSPSSDALFCGDLIDVEVERLLPSFQWPRVENRNDDFVAVRSVLGALPVLPPAAPFGAHFDSECERRHFRRTTQDATGAFQYPVLQHGDCVRTVIVLPVAHWETHSWNSAPNSPLRNLENALSQLRIPLEGLVLTALNPFACEGDKGIDSFHPDFDAVIQAHMRSILQLGATRILAFGAYNEYHWSQTLRRLGLAVSDLRISESEVACRVALQPSAAHVGSATRNLQVRTYLAPPLSASPHHFGSLCESLRAAYQIPFQSDPIRSIEKMHVDVAEAYAPIAVEGATNRFLLASGVLTHNCDILWSDPDDGPGRRPSPRGAGLMFGQDVSHAWLHKNKMRLIIRSHECQQRGFAMHHGDTIITVFSASNYCGTVNNEGAFIILERDLVPRIVPFYAKPKERLSRYRMRHALLENDIISKLLQRIADNRLALTNYYNKVASVTAAGVRTVSRAIWAEGLKVTLQLNIPFAEFQDYLGLPKLGVDGKKKGDIDFQAFLLRFRPVNAMLNPLTPPVASPAASNSGSPAPSSRRSSSRTVNQNVECILEMLAKHKYELESLFRHFDLNGDESISLSEFKEGVTSLQTLLGYEFTTEDLDALIRHIDTNNDNHISYAEFFNGFRLADPALSDVQRKAAELLALRNKTGSGRPPSATPSPTLTPRSLEEQKSWKEE